MGRRVLWALAAVGLLVAAACGSGTEGGEGGGGGGEDGQAVVNFFVGTEETPRLEAEAVKTIEQFMAENPEITVERESITPEDQRTVIQTRLRSPNPPDLFGYDTGPGFAGVLAQAGLLYDLGEAYKDYNWPVYDWAQQRVTYDGVLSGVPGSVEEIGVYYNATMFEEMGFEEPQTLEELQEIADALKADGIIPFAVGDQEKWPAGHLFSIGISNLLGKEGLDEILYGDGRWDSPEGIRAIEVMFTEMVENGYYPEDVNAITYEDANSLFYAGQAAMIPTGTWLVVEIDETVQNFDVEFFPFPSIDGSGISPPGGVGGGLFMAAETDAPEATLKLLDYLQFNEENVKRDLELFNTIPPFDIDTSGLDVTPLFQSVLDDLSESEGFGYNLDVLTPQRFNTVMFDGFQEVLNGDRTPEEQAEALQAAWEEAKEKGETLEAP
jgi:raffinose/stachyose/melibiose transport system substrate-binding protein